MVYFFDFLVGYIGIALVQHIAITDGLANELRELGHISKHTDIEFHVPLIVCAASEHFRECAGCAVNTIENALIAVWEIAAVNTCVKRA